MAEFAASMTGLSYAAVLPVAAAELDGLALYGLAVALPGVVGIAFLALGPYLYARIGPQAQLSLSSLVLVLGVCLSVAAPTMEVLVAGLALRGVASGLMGGLGMGILSELYPDAGERERAFGLYALMWVAPSLVGPVINGVLLATVGWRPSMAWPAVLILFARALISYYLRRIPFDRPDAPGRVRGVGPLLAIAVGLLLAQVSIATSEPGWVIGAIVLLGLVLVGPFRQALLVMVPTEPRTRAGGWVLTLICGGYFGVNSLVPLLAFTYIDATGVLGAVLVSLGPLAWALMSAGGLGARLSSRRIHRLAAASFPAAAAGVVAWALLPGMSAPAGAVVLGLVALLVGITMGAVYPRVMTLAFEGFRGGNGTNRAHGGVVLGLSEDVGTASGVTLLAGTGGIAVGLGTGSVAILAGAFAVVLLAGWVIVSRSSLWDS